MEAIEINGHRRESIIKSADVITNIAHVTPTLMELIDYIDTRHDKQMGDPTEKWNKEIFTVQNKVYLLETVALLSRLSESESFHITSTIDPLFNEN